VSEILGETGVTHLRIKNVATGEESDLAAAAVFACTGLVPNTRLLGGRVPLDASGRIRVDAAMRTKAVGLCAAGNVREASPHRAAAAMGDGATAAIAIDKYLATGRWQDAD